MIPGEAYGHEERVPRSYLVKTPLSLWGFALRTGLLMAVSAGLCWFSWWAGQVLGAVAGVFAGGFLLLPYFSWAEFKLESAIKDTANEMMEAHSVATVEFVNLRLNQEADRAMRWLHTEREDDRLLIATIRLERDSIQQRLQPFIAPRKRAPNGRWLKLTPEQKKIGSGLAAPRILTAELTRNSSPAIEGSPR